MDFSKDWIREKFHVIMPNDIEIPKNLHIIWVGNKEMPDYVIPNVNKWKELMPDWNVRLWKNEDINTDEFPEHIVEKINECTIGAQKADIMRYFIVQKYGGFYMDTDTIPFRSLTPLTQMGFDIVVYHDNFVTWEYLCNSPFGATANHPVVNRACELVETAQINTSDPNFHTGPKLWGRALAETPTFEKKFCLLWYKFFDHKEYFEGKYGSHTYAASWMH